MRKMGNANAKNAKLHNYQNLSQLYRRFIATLSLPILTWKCEKMTLNAKNATF